jgi:NAD(P)-dependent dehydrogenase (short-subunit alcohol dehydrogenase family)
VKKMRSSNRETAIVTGAARGIGRAIALRLARDDYFVIIADVDEKTGRDTVNAIGQKSSDFIPCDVGNETSVKNLYKNIRQNNGNVTVLVNNAGIIRDNVIWKMSASEFDAVIRVNLRGAWLMCREAAGIMRENRKGRIINIASRAWLGNPGQTNYSASKAGIVGLTRALALELAKYTRSLPDQVQEKLIAAQPTKNMGQPEDIAETVVFLASEKAGFITGQVFHVDGGKSIGTTV